MGYFHECDMIAYNRIPEFEKAASTQIPKQTDSSRLRVVTSKSTREGGPPETGRSLGCARASQAPPAGLSVHKAHSTSFLVRLPSHTQPGLLSWNWEILDWSTHSCPVTPTGTMQSDRDKGGPSLCSQSVCRGGGRWKQ